MPLKGLCPTLGSDPEPLYKKKPCMISGLFLDSGLLDAYSLWQRQLLEDFKRIPDVWARMLCMACTWTPKVRKLVAQNLEKEPKAMVLHTDVIQAMGTVQAWCMFTLFAIEALSLLQRIFHDLTQPIM